MENETAPPAFPTLDGYSAVPKLRKRMPGILVTLSRTDGCARRVSPRVAGVIPRMKAFLQLPNGGHCTHYVWMYQCLQESVTSAYATGQMPGETLRGEMFTTLTGAKSTLRASERPVLHELV
ncbi:hypothetical protein Y1Q_0015050 [Alligator mississippiensis]|uniref:Uncharacterized protein n=1 Tax=Alligator mississippiensis TaxID=8496 RepID=A0A151P9E2_ALLMI|nr:hypothetical protein Y1Q_0015050 [Alligator mississippiensis]